MALLAVAQDRCLECAWSNKHHQSCDPCPLIVEPWCDGTELTWQTWNHCPNYTWKKSRIIFSRIKTSHPHTSGPWKICLPKRKNMKMKVSQLHIWVSLNTGPKISSGFLNINHVSAWLNFLLISTIQISTQKEKTIPCCKWNCLWCPVPHDEVTASGRMCGASPHLAAASSCRSFLALASSSVAWPGLLPNIIAISPKIIGENGGGVVSNDTLAAWNPLIIKGTKTQVYQHFSYE